MVTCKGCVLLFLCGLHAASAFMPTGLFSLRHSSSSRTARLQTNFRVKREPANLVRMKIGGGEEDVPTLERVIACLPYALPLSDAFEWGHFLFDKFPLLSIPFIPLFPVISLLNAPFVSFGVFIVLFSFVTRNPSFSR